MFSVVSGFCLLDLKNEDDNDNETAFSDHWPESEPPFSRGQRPGCHVGASTVPQEAEWMPVNAVNDSGVGRPVAPLHSEQGHQATIVLPRALVLTLSCVDPVLQTCGRLLPHISACLSFS